MSSLPEHPVVGCIMRTGYPPWMQQRERDCNRCGVSCWENELNDDGLCPECLAEEEEVDRE